MEVVDGVVADLSTGSGADAVRAAVAEAGVEGPIVVTCPRCRAPRRFTGARRAAARAGADDASRSSSAFPNDAFWALRRPAARRRTGRGRGRGAAAPAARRPRRSPSRFPCAGLGDRPRRREGPSARWPSFTSLQIACRRITAGVRPRGRRLVPVRGRAGRPRRAARWERQRESDLAYVEARLAQLEAAGRVGRRPTGGRPTRVKSPSSSTTSSSRAGSASSSSTRASSRERHGFDRSLVLTRASRTSEHWATRALAAPARCWSSIARASSATTSRSRHGGRRRYACPELRRRPPRLLRAVTGGPLLPAATTAERAAAALTHDLPVAFITEARWIADTLEAAAPDAPLPVSSATASTRTSSRRRCARRAPRRAAADPGRGQPRRLVQGRPRGAEAVPADARAAPRDARSPRHGPRPAATARRRVVGPLGTARWPALRESRRGAQALARGGHVRPAARGLPQGRDVRATPVTGHDEYVVHGENGLVVDWDDARGTARRSTCWRATGAAAPAALGRAGDRARLAVGRAARHDRAARSRGRGGAARRTDGRSGLLARRAARRDRRTRSSPPSATTRAGGADRPDRGAALEAAAAPRWCAAPVGGCAADGARDQDRRSGLRQRPGGHDEYVEARAAGRAAARAGLAPRWRRRVDGAALRRRVRRPVLPRAAAGTRRSPTSCAGWSAAGTRVLAVDRRPGGRSSGPARRGARPARVVRAVRGRRPLRLRRLDGRRRGRRHGLADRRTRADAARRRGARYLVQDHEPEFFAT